MFIPKAAAGDFALPRNEERILVKGAVGYSFLIFEASVGFPEYKPNRGGFERPHDARPHNAVWHKKGTSSDGKEGLYLVDIDGNPGNRIEETIYVRVLVLPDDHSAPFVVTQPTSRPPSRSATTCSVARLARSTARIPILSSSNGG